MYLLNLRGPRLRRRPLGAVAGSESSAAVFRFAFPLFFLLTFGTLGARSWLKVSSLFFRYGGGEVALHVAIPSRTLCFVSSLHFVFPWLSLYDVIKRVAANMRV